MIYLNVEDLGWQPFVTSWLASKKNDALVAHLTKLIERYALGPPLTAVQSGGVLWQEHAQSNCHLHFVCLCDETSRL